MHVLSVVLLSPTIVLSLQLPWSIVQHIPYWRGTSSHAVKVPVQLGVMSRCPDALLCENAFNQVLKKVSDKMDLSLVYVAKYVLRCWLGNLRLLAFRLDSSEPDFGVKCMHGAEECAGNVQQLCVAKYEPTFWWEFVQCQNYEGRQNIGNPALALKCARVTGIDWETSKAGKCAGLDGSGRGAEGVGLLKESLALGQKLGIEYVTDTNFPGNGSLLNWNDFQKKLYCTHQRPSSLYP